MVRYDRQHERTAATVRPAAVAGMFYAADARTLERDVDAYLRAVAETGVTEEAPKALIVPHAGYVYSAPIAASAYRRLAPARGKIRRVVLLGPCHRVGVHGLALPGARAFQTPLGSIEIDQDAVAAIAHLPQVVQSAAAHAEEHSLEVQLPFLQRVLGDFKLVPFAVGWVEPAQVAEVIEALWGGPETLVVVSSDLSHYHPYHVASGIDRETAEAIVAGRGDLDHEQACGATPIAGLLLTARRRGLSAELLDLRNSGDTAGDHSRVVGYGAFAFREPLTASRGDDEDVHRGRRLLGIARGAIASQLGRGAAPAIDDEPWLREPAATFVTLMQGADLRGCIGTLEPHRALGEDVHHNARAAAFSDPRFAPVRATEVDDLDVEVSLLTSPTPIRFSAHHELIAQLRPGRDGLILESGIRRATFLPQVWDSLPSPEEFLAHLKSKAGFATSTPSERFAVSRYEVMKWKEADLM